MTRGRRVNILVVFDQSERSFRWSFPVALLRVLMIGGAVIVLFAAAAFVLMLRGASQQRRLAEMTADNKRLSAYVLEVDQLREELSRHREFTRRLCDLIGVSFPDSAFAPLVTESSRMPAGPMNLSVSASSPWLDSARLPTELAADRQNRPLGTPMNGRPSRGFAADAESPSLRHYGLDIAGHEGSPVYATAAGVVEFAGWDETMGQTVILDHQNGYKSVYGHNSVLICEVHQQVSFGELICLSGNSGRSSAPHLHYEIRLQNRPVDPVRFLFPESGAVAAGDTVSR